MTPRRGKHPQSLLARLRKKSSLLHCVTLLVTATLVPGPGLRVMAAPPLEIDPLEGNRIELSWPDTVGEVRLESSRDLGKTFPWLPYAIPPTLSGGRFSQEIETGAMSSFFRLADGIGETLTPTFNNPPSANSSLFPGQTLTFTLSATDPGGAAVSYLASPLPLPEGASLNMTTGVFRWVPGENQIGLTRITFLAYNGIGNGLLPINITVKQPPLNGTTSLSGILLDTTNAVNGEQVPIVGAIVSLLDSGITAPTGIDGRFTLSGIPAGTQVLDLATVSANPAPDGSPYAGFREAIKIVAGIPNEVSRPFYLPRIAVGSLAKVDPNFTTDVVNEDLGVSIKVPPHTALLGEQEFTGNLSISLVPEALAPAVLPENLGFGQLVTVQPVGVRFADPVPIIFPNLDGLAPGSETDIWSLDPDAGVFSIVGRGKVTEDGRFIETIEGGVIAADWHGTLPPAPPSSPPPPPPCPDCCSAPGFGGGAGGAPGSGPGGGPSPLSLNDDLLIDEIDFNTPATPLETMDPAIIPGHPRKISSAEIGDSTIHFSSQASPATGNLSTTFSTPYTSVAGESRGIDFVYQSSSAFPQALIPVDSAIEVRSAVPPTISYQIELGGISQSHEIFVSTAGFSESRDEPFRFVATFDASAFETGIYPYEIKLSAQFGQSVRSVDVSGSTTIANTRESEFGSGWGLSGLQRIHKVPNQKKIILTDGGGLATAFSDSVSGNQFVLGGFNAQRAGDYSVTEGALFDDARARLAILYPRLEMASFPELSTANLADVDLLVLNPLAGSTLGNPISSSEQAALLAFIRGGGAVILTLDHDLGRISFRDAIAQLLAPLSIVATNSQAFSYVPGDELPPVIGELGRVTRVGLPFGGAHFQSLGPWAKSLIAAEGGSGLAVIDSNVISAGSGRVVVLPDTQTFSDSAAFGLTSTTQNEILLGNSIEYCLRGGLSGVNTLLFPPLGLDSPITLRPDGTYFRILPDGHTNEFNAAGILVKTVTATGLETTFTYDTSQRLTRVNWPAGGGATSLAYAGAKLATLSNPAGQTTGFQYDAVGNLVRATFPDASSRSFGYDSRHLMISETDAAGQVTTRTFDNLGSIVGAVLPGGTTRALTASISAGAVLPGSPGGTQANPVAATRPDEVLASYTNGLGVIKQFTIGQSGGSNLVTDPLGILKEFQRDENGKPVRETAPDGSIIERIYNEKAKLVKETYLGIPGVANPAFPTSSEYSYDDKTGLMTRFKQANGAVYTTEINENGNPAKYEDSSGLVTNLEFADPRFPDHFTSLTRAPGTPFESITRMEYDPATGRVAKYTGPGGNSTSSSYTTAGQLARYTDTEGKIQRRQYDAMNRLTKLIDPSNALPAPATGTSGVFSYEYDGEGNLVKLIDPKGGAVTFTYDGQGRLVRRVDTLGQAETIGYDAEGRITATVDRKGQRIEYAYDVRNRLVRKTLLAGTANAYAVTMTYGNAAYPIKVSGPDSTLNFTYDAFDRITSVSTTGSPHQPDVTLGYKYNAARQLVSMQDPTGTTSYGFDAFGRATSVTNPSMLTMEFSYDLLDRFTGVTYPNGTETEVAYNLNDRESSQINRIIAGNTFAGFGYQYNGEGHPVMVAQTRTDLAVAATQTFAFDDLYRVTRATHPLSAVAAETFQYDPVGNRLRQSGDPSDATIDAEDRLIEDARYRFTYDTNGNPTSRTAKTSGEVTRYGYDPENRLVTLARFANAAAAIPSTQARYRFDVLGRRIVKEVDGVITRYLYDDAEILLEYSGAGKLLARYTHGPIVDQPLVMERDLDANDTFSTDEAFFYHTDRLGSIVALTDSAATVRQSYAYDSFGTIVALRCGAQTFTGNAVRTQLAGTTCLANPFTFTAREYDPESALYHYRARSYDATLGRFLQQDIYAGSAYRTILDDPPGGRSVVLDVFQYAFGGGQGTHYAYLQNSPLNGTDPSGMWDWPWSSNQAKEGAKTFCSANTPLGVGEGAAVVEALVDVAKSGAVENQLFVRLTKLCIADFCGAHCLGEDTKALACKLADEYYTQSGSGLGQALKWRQSRQKEFDSLLKKIERDKCASGCK